MKKYFLHSVFLPEAVAAERVNFPRRTLRVIPTVTGDGASLIIKYHGRE